MSSKVHAAYFMIPVCLVIFFLAATATVAKGKYQGKRILWVDSYGKGYPWSDGIEMGIKAALVGTGVRIVGPLWDLPEERSSVEGKWRSRSCVGVHRWLCVLDFVSEVVLQAAQHVLDTLSD